MDTLALTMSIICCVVTVLNLVLGRKDKSVKEGSTTSYNQGRLDEKIQTILDKLNKIEKHLEVYDKEIDEKIEVALKHHIKEWHKGE